MIAAEVFRRKPTTVEAMQYTGKNAPAVLFWVGVRVGQAGGCESELAKPVQERAAFVNPDTVDGALFVRTLNGPVPVFPGNWVIRGSKGEFYPCDEEVFAETYEKAAL